MRIAHNTIDRTGEVHNCWTVVEYIYTDKFRKRRYLCRCICGKENIRTLTTILSGKSLSCGCQNIKNHTFHGKSGHRVYNIWQNIKNRCLNPKSTNYRYYGGRGIEICKEWVDSFEKFYLDMGDPTTDKHSIDRINNELGYFKENCRWATMSEQALNRRLPEPPK